MPLTTFYSARYRAVDDNGAPYPNAYIEFFEAGTTTPLNVYSDVDGTVSLGAVVTADSGGLFPEMFMLPQAYDYDLYDEDDVLVWSVTDYFPPDASAAANLDVTGVAGVTFAAGEGAYVSDGSGGLNAGELYKWDADLEYASATPELYFATEAITAGETGRFRQAGLLTGLAGLVPGAVYYVSGTAGAISTSPGTYPRVVGMAKSTTELFVATNPASAILLRSLTLTTQLIVQGTGADSIDTAGGIQAGSGNVGIVDATGKIPALSAAYLTNDSGQSLTGIPVLLHANSGSTTNAAAEDVDTYALASQLTAKDRLIVYFAVQAVTQQTAAVLLRNSTDPVTIIDIWDSGAGALPAGRSISGSVILQQFQSAATAIGAYNAYGTNVPNAQALGASASFTTAWTGAWTIALRQTGVTAGGVFRWSWAIYRVQGQ